MSSAFSNDCIRSGLLLRKEPPLIWLTCLKATAITDVSNLRLGVVQRVMKTVTVPKRNHGFQFLESA